MSDVISRQAAINAMGRAEWAINRINELPSAQPEHTNSWCVNSWCNNCKEYDKEKHSCPRFNRVIKQTLDEIYSHAEIVRCKDCKHYVNIRRTNRFWCDTDDGIGGENPEPDDFCSRAERRTDE